MSYHAKHFAEAVPWPTMQTWRAALLPVLVPSGSDENKRVLPPGAQVRTSTPLSEGPWGPRAGGTEGTVRLPSHAVTAPTSGSGRRAPAGQPGEVWADCTGVSHRTGPQLPSSSWGRLSPPHLQPSPAHSHGAVRAQLPPVALGEGRGDHRLRGAPLVFSPHPLGKLSHLHSPVFPASRPTAPRTPAAVPPDWLLGACHTHSQECPSCGGDDRGAPASPIPPPLCVLLRTILLHMSPHQAARTTGTPHRPSRLHPESLCSRLGTAGLFQMVSLLTHCGTGSGAGRAVQTHTDPASGRGSSAPSQQGSHSPRPLLPSDVREHSPVQVRVGAAFGPPQPPARALRRAQHLALSLLHCCYRPGTSCIHFGDKSLVFLLRFL